MLSLFQGSLAHCKHIISHVLCIREIRDIVRSWLLGSLFQFLNFIRGIEFKIFTVGRNAKIYLAYICSGTTLTQNRQIDSPCSVLL